MPLLQSKPRIKGGELGQCHSVILWATGTDLTNWLTSWKVPRMDANNAGYIQHKPLQWDNECTRHKLLDIIGDMALIGENLSKDASTATRRPGHTVNNKFARLMRKEIRKHEDTGTSYDPNGSHWWTTPHPWALTTPLSNTISGQSDSHGIPEVLSESRTLRAMSHSSEGHFPGNPWVGVLQKWRQWHSVEVC